MWRQLDRYFEGRDWKGFRDTLKAPNLLHMLIFCSSLWHIRLVSHLCIAACVLNKSWPSGPLASFAPVVLVSAGENYNVPLNWNTTWMHVLIRFVHGFSKCLPSSARESCADSLTCHHKSRAFAEGKLTEKMSLQWDFFPSPLLS